MWVFQFIDITMSKMLGFWSISEIIIFILKIDHAFYLWGLFFVRVGWGDSVSLPKFFSHSPVIVTCTSCIEPRTLCFENQICLTFSKSALCKTILSSLIKNKKEKFSQLLTAIYIIEINPRNQSFNKMETEYAIIKILI